MIKISHQRRKRKKIDDYIEKKILDHENTDAIKDITFKSLVKCSLHKKNMPDYAADRKTPGQPRQRCFDEKTDDEESEDYCSKEEE
ncbi:hypothetical protein JXB31_05315 [Candidatus Woesearchaeota archaeon]|nr:hypothetical protein [Candidatus Woesearchaeota archaeon]